MIEEKENIQEEQNDLPVKTDSLSAITKKISDEEDVDKIKDLTKLFNLAMMKKEINRAEKQSDMLDYALDEVNNRMISGEMSDKDLANYIKIFQDSINNSKKNTSDEMIPPIQINAKEINIGSSDSLTREERENVIDFIQKVLTQSKDNDIIDVEPIEKEIDKEDDN